MENETKHTPGPWTWEREAHPERNKREDHCIWSICPAASPLQAVARIENSGFADASQSAERCDANARLIAASPSLVDALRRAIPWLEDAARKGNQQLEKLWSDLADAREALRDAGVTP